MRKIILSVFIVITALPSITYGERELEMLPPCTAILQPVGKVPKNARGVALIYHIERKFNDHRTSLSVNALHLPKPSSFGDYNSYEVLAFIPQKISWIFSLAEYGESNWAGNLDEISSTMRPNRIKVRAINTRTNKVGPVVLEKKVNCPN